VTKKEFIVKTVEHYLGKGIKVFPADFVETNFVDLLDIPQKTLILGEELFGSFEIITTDGSQVLLIDDLMKGRFIVYASCNANGLIEIPQEMNMVKDAVEKYENYIDFILVEIQKDFKTAFPDSENNLNVINEVFKKLNLKRI
jgi:hypothetical protein